MRLLFVKQALMWPRVSGHDVHTFYMMKACGELGHDVALATVEEPSPDALAGLDLDGRFVLTTRTLNGTPIGGTRLQKRFARFWGVPDGRIEALREVVRQWRPEAVIIVGLDALPYFPSISGAVRVWYAADEWVLHHLSQLQLHDGGLSGHLYSAAVKGLYERAFRRVVDRAWVVSEGDRRAMRWLAGVSQVDILPNGVDGEHFSPRGERATNRSAIFWGRLDFGPNIQALEWFCRRVWPSVVMEAPDAHFTILGFNPGDAVRSLAATPGISLLADVPDLRETVRRHAVAVLPFVSGAGIKNKLLEAAALGLPILCTPTATQGLRGKNPPLVVADTPEACATSLIQLWNSPERRRQLGDASREWVLTHHTWEATAREAIHALQQSARS